MEVPGVPRTDLDWLLDDEEDEFVRFLEFLYTMLGAPPSVILPPGS